MSFPDITGESDFQPVEDQIENNNNNDFNNFMNMDNKADMGPSSTALPELDYNTMGEIDEEEQKRIEERKKEEEERRKKIEEKINYELQIKNENREKAVKFMNEFEEYIIYIINIDKGIKILKIEKMKIWKMKNNF